MQAPVRRILLGSFLLAILSLVLFAASAPSASAAGPTSLSRTPWQMWRPATYVSPVPSYAGGSGVDPTHNHGNIAYYTYAPAIPSTNDPGWTPAPNGDTINFGHGNFSRLTTCWTQVDFTFFQTLVDIPAGTILTTFSIDFSGMDDGSRITIFNSLYPGGLVVPGSYVYLGGSGTTNLAPYVEDGETNRVVVTQMDDCAVGNQLQSAKVNLNGTFIPPNNPPSVSASIASVVINEGQTANNSGTYSDPDTGNNVAISVSVGTVTKTGTNSGSWSWSFGATDGPSQSQIVAVTVNDGNGGVTNTTFQLTVNNVAPSLSVNVGANNTVYYVNWTSASPGAGTAAGVINLPGGSTVNVTFEAVNPNNTPSFFYGAQTSGGTNYWIPSSPYISTEVPNAPPDSDILQLSGGNATIYRVTFSQPIANPIMAIVSLGAPRNTMTYNFDAPFAIVSQDVGFFTGCPTCLVQLPNNVLQGTEGHGTIKFIGTYTTFSWTVPNPEIWHGFTFAIQSTTALGNINVNEGDTATNSGTWADPGVNDNVSLTASVGNVVKNANGTWNWSFATSDGPAQSQPVTITATDKDGAFSSSSFPLVVNNVAPTSSLSNTGPVVEGSPVTINFGPQFDPSTADIAAGLHFAFDCGGGTLAGSNYGNSGTQLSTTCWFNASGTYTVTGKVTDKDGGAKVLSTVVQVNLPPTPPFSQPYDGPAGCICTPLFMNTNNQGAEHLFFKASGTSVDLTVFAHAVNSTDAETVMAEVFDTTNNSLVAPALVASYPAGTASGSEDDDSATITTVAGRVYRIRITTPVSTPQQPHWRAVIDGATAAAINGPTWASIEPDAPVTWFFGVGSGENLDVRVFSSGTPSPLSGNQSLTFQWIGPAGSLAGGPVVVAGPYPVDQTMSAPGASSSAGLWGLRLSSADSHYRLERTDPSADPAVYMTAATAGHGTINGTVVTATGSPFTGAATVSVYALNGATPGALLATTVTNTGTFNFTNVPVGHARVQVTPPPGASVVGSPFFDVFVVCDDEVSGSFTLNRPPTVTLIAPPSVNEGAAPAPLTTTSFDPDGDPLTFGWALVGPGTLVPGGTSATYANADGPATADATVMVTDAAGATDSDTKAIATLNVAPTVEAGANRTIDEAGSVSLAPATFNDLGTLDTHSATIDWGDGTATEAGTVVEAGGAGTVAGSHVYGDDGVFTVTVCVTDDDLATTCDSLVVTVNNLAPALDLNTAGSVTLPSGVQAFLGRKGTAQSHSADADDPGSDDLTFTWSFGSSTTYFNNGASVDPDPSPAGVFPFSASNTASVTFTAPGVLTIGVTAADDDGGTDADSLRKLVTDDCDCTRSQGFWKHQFDPDRKGGNLIPVETLQTYLDIIGEASGTFVGLTPEEAYGILNPKPAKSGNGSGAGNGSGSNSKEATTAPGNGSGRKKGDGGADDDSGDDGSGSDDGVSKAKAQTLAAWLNFAKGAIGWDELVDTNGDKVPDTTFGAIIAEVESILSNPGATDADLERAKDLAESVNVHDKNNPACDTGSDNGAGSDQDNGTADGAAPAPAPEKKDAKDNGKKGADDKKGQDNGKSGKGDDDKGKKGKGGK